MARKLITYIPAPLAPTGIQTRCCYRMTYGNRRTSQRGSKQRSYTAGNPRHRNCDCQATRYIDGQPFCSMHAPEPKIKRINGRWHEDGQRSVDQAGDQADRGAAGRLRGVGPSSTEY